MDQFAKGKSHQLRQGQNDIITEPTESEAVYVVEVTGLAETVNECILRTLFEVHGQLFNNPIIYRFDERYALVKFTSLKDAKKSVVELNNTLLHGLRIYTALREGKCLETPIRPVESKCQENSSNQSSSHSISISGFSTSILASESLTDIYESQPCSDLPNFSCTHSDFELQNELSESISSQTDLSGKDFYAPLESSPLLSRTQYETYSNVPSNTSTTADKCSKDPWSMLENEICKSKQGPKKTAVKKSAYKVKVSHLSKGVTKNMLHDLFKVYGKMVGRPEIIRTTKMPYAWVRFSGLQEAKNAVTSLDNTPLAGDIIRVKLAESKRESEENSPSKKAVTFDHPAHPNKPVTSDHLPPPKKPATSDHLTPPKKPATFDHLPSPKKPATSDHVSYPKKPVTSDHLACPEKPAPSDHLPHPKKPVTSDHLAHPKKPTTSNHLVHPKKSATSDHVSYLKKPVTSDHLAYPRKSVTSGHLVHPKKPATSDPLARPKKPATSDHVSHPKKPVTSDHLARPKKPATSDPLARPKKPATSDHVSHPKKPATSDHLTRPKKPATSDHVSHPGISGHYPPHKKGATCDHLSTRSKNATKKESVQCEPKAIQPFLDEKIVSVIDSALQDCYLQCKYEQSQLPVEIPKNCPLAVAHFNKLVTEREINAVKLQELENRKNEFTCYCKNFRTQLLSRSKCLNEKEISETIKREASRFQTGLPIYSHRQEIVHMVRNNQVSILTAETGSGKSTQLVQYIHESGLAKNGTIVCTQPRKVAAMSLAEFVSSELQQKLGTLVGYKTGVYSRLSKQTRILYVTDHALLNECTNDTSFSKYSCIIVDEAHERNLHTDVLLAFIKQKLSLRPDLRVIITSATIDPEIFTQYFGDHCPVMNISGRLFPVEIIYDVVAFNSGNQPTTTKKLPNYVQKAIDLVKELHVTEPKGDILVFLTSPGEVEQACKVLESHTQRSATVLALHGKLQPDDQQKVFKTYPKRKIVFSTNVAETSITIPGIKYIVDCGLAKELSFDAKKNMNSLEVRTISKSSADQRKGRAGRTSEGKCYRLYSKDTYNNMPQRTLPEILRTSLSGTVLKLHELGIKNVFKFDYIETPDHAALESAVKMLEFLRATDRGCLTKIGKKMSLLPIDPRLSKIILDSSAENITSEAVASVSISSLAGTIFFRGNTEEMKKHSDLQKSTFCHPLGDQITYLVTYNEWLSQKQSSQNAWCQANSINAKSMRIIKETVKELQLILKQHLHLSCQHELLNMQRALKKLPFLYFKAFANNVCVFLGHEKVGYYNPSLPGEILAIFPGSSLPYLNLMPTFLVFEKTLKTSQHFLLQALPVEEEWVQEAVQSGLLKCHPNSCDEFQKLVVTPFTMHGLGKYTLDCVMREQKQIVKKLTCTDAHLKEVQFVMSPDGSSLKVFVQLRFHDHMRQIIEDYVRHLRNKLKCFVFETGITADDDNVRVIIGSGGNILNLLMPNQFRTVVARGLVDEKQTEEIIGLLSTCGSIEKHHFSSDKNLYVTFSDPKSAADAVNLVNEISDDMLLKVSPKIFKKQEGFSMSLFSLKVEWYRRDRKNFVNINFKGSTPSKIASVCDQLETNFPAMHIPGFSPEFTQSKYQPQKEIFVRGVSPHLSEDDVVAGISEYLAPLGYSEDSYKVIFCSTEKFETTLEEFEQLRESLHTLVAQHASNFNIHFEFPQNYHRKYMAFINFSELSEGLDALAALKHSRIDSKQLSVKPCLTSTSKYSLTMYLAVEESIREAVADIHTQYKSVTITEKHAECDVVVKVRSNDPSEYIGALNMLNAVLKPLTISCVSSTRSEYLRSKQCETDALRIEKQSNTVICKDFHTRCLKIFGTHVSKKLAETEFNKRLSLYDRDANCYELELKSMCRPPGLLKHLITNYGVELDQLLVMDGIVMARIDVRKHLLILCATSVGYQALLKVIEQFTKSKLLKTEKSSTDQEFECCICYAQIESSEWMYTLEYCSHTCHYECIEAQLAPHAITVPVLCAAEECSEPFVWQDFVNLQSKGHVRLRDVITQCVQTYVEANNDTVHHCPTPDCRMVYTVSSERGCFLCSHCGVLTCTKCHNPFHSGLSCATNLQGHDVNDQLQSWLQSDPKNHKRCPNCDIPIEKTGGCFHVRCKLCRSHICWHCLERFKTSEECYDHLSDYHGGFF